MPDPRTNDSYCVKEGDTLASIAERFYDSEEATDALAARNDLAPDASLKAGQELALPLRAFTQEDATQKGSNICVVPLRVHQAQFCYVKLEEALPAKDGTTTTPIAGKWIYIVADDAIVATVDAQRSDCWSVTNDLFEETKEVTDGWIRLRPNKEYRFLLSPIELSDDAKRQLVEDSDFLIAEPLSFEAEATEVRALKDPFAWTVELHAQRYRPRLEAWREWLFDEMQTSELFIAGALEQLIGSEDPLSIQGHLQDGQPDEWLENYEKKETARRRATEEAMAEIAVWAESVEHRIVERAALDNRGNDLHMAIVQWAAFMQGAGETLPGRHLIRNVANAEERIPRKLILAESSTEVDVAFREHRYLATAAMSLLSDLAPAVADMLRGRPDKWEVLELWLSRYAEEKPLRGHYKRVHRALQKGRRITQKLATGQRNLTKLLRKSEASRDAVVKIPRSLARAETLSAAYERNLGTAARSSVFVLETLNLAMALRELSDASRGASLMDIVSAGGAASDFGLAIVESYEILAAEAAKVGIKSTAFVLGMVSGICDTIDFLVSAGNSASKHDYNAMVGHGIAAVGAIGIAVGSGIALAELIAGGAVVAGATGVGLIVAITGAALVAVGSVLSAIFTDNAYEQFAAHSFLGENADGAPDEFSWAPRRIQLPTRNRTDEMRALLALLSNFRTSVFSWDSVSIFPGYYQDGDELELFIYHAYNNYKLGPLVCHIRVDLSSGDIRQVAGNRPLAEKSVVQYDDAGRVEEVKLAIEEGNPRPDLLLPFKSQTMWIRLRSHHGFTVPPREESGADVWHRATYTIDSFDRSHTSGSSLQRDYRATADHHPPPANLEPIP